MTARRYAQAAILFVVFSVTVNCNFYRILVRIKASVGVVIVAVITVVIAVVAVVIVA